MEQLSLVAEKYEGGRCGIRLRHILDFQPLALVRRRLHTRCRVIEPIV